MKQLLILTLCLIISLGTRADSSVSVVGVILDEVRQPLLGVAVSVQGAATTTDNNGYYSITVKVADTYQVSFESVDYYQALQTFSHFELARLDTSQLVIGDIELVKKIKGRTLLAFGGDVMMGRRYSSPYFNNQPLITKGQESADTKKIVKHVKPYMSLADFAVVNLETQIAVEEPSQRAPKSVTFFSPPQTLSALEWAGIDYVSLGNNHTFDYMDQGLKSSLAYLNKSGLAYSGAGLNQQQALVPYRVSLNGQGFSMLGFVGWQGNFSPNQTADADKGGAAYGSLKNITTAVQKEVLAGQATVVQYHGSQEYAPEPSLVTEQRLKSAIDSGADLAIGHHPHVTQGFEIYNDKLIAYSMGNFIFDQYFYSTPHSFILYVWMDGEKFHRAEIIPIYLKGYKPTPATGMHRFTVLKRLRQLSKKRGVNIYPSGGHGVITARSSKQKYNSDFQIFGTGKANIMPLYRSDWSQQLSAIKTDDPALSYRLGVNLVNGSDFESYDSFDSKERGWNVDQNSFAISEQKSFSGKHAMKTILPVKGSDIFAMTNFRRVYKTGNPMTVALRVNASHDSEIKVYWQGRNKKDKFKYALNKGKRHLLKTISVAGSNAWQVVEVPFNSPRIGYKSIRMMVEITNKDPSQKNTVFIDDVALIEWQSAYSTIARLPITNGLTSQASYIEFSRPLSVGETVELIYR
ncbi:MAG: CapA family protein [Gammaproteobacteria bacterium]|nr:CapA family protein [Gammaproteobacteria bacterium]